MTIAPGKPKHKARWYQYSLGSLLLLMLVLAFFSAWLGNRVAKARRQASAVAQLKALGAVVYYDYEHSSEGFEENKKDRQWRDKLVQPGSSFLRQHLGVDFFAKVVVVELSGNGMKREDWAKIGPLQELTDIEEVVIGPLEAASDEDREDGESGKDRKGLSLEQFRSAIDSDRLLDILVRLPKLRRLKMGSRGQFTYLFGGHVLRSNGVRPAYVALSEQAQRSLGGLTSLEQLELDCVNLGDDGAQQISKLPKLQRLRIEYGGVGDKDLRFLGELQELRELRISPANGVTDAGLVHLEKLHDLEELDISDASVTDAGVVHLRPLTRLRELTQVREF